MKSKFFLFLLIFLFLSSCSKEIDKSPNILIFLVDDLGWNDTSVPFAGTSTINNNFYQTPNISKLASQGMIFTNGYASCTVCSPTRTSILTGKSPARNRITQWIPGTPDRGADVQVLGPPDWRIEGLDESDITLPKVLREEGYLTVHLGKAHFGMVNHYGADPKNLGFEINIGGKHTGAPRSYHYPYGKNDHSHHVEDLEQYDSLFLSEALSLEAVRVLDEWSEANKDRPFFMHMAHYAVHTPIMANEELIHKYDTTGRRMAQVKYATMIESVDNSLGKIMEKLEDLGELENTIIVFTSDNGGLATHAGPPTDNLPLADGKGTSREGGTRVPWIIKWNKKIQPNTINSSPVISHDLFPTLVKAAGIETEFDNLDGIDISKIIDKNNTDRTLIWHFPHYWANASIRSQYPSVGPHSSIRKGDWKLVYFYEGDRFELYDLLHDIGESTNLIEENMEFAQSLCQIMTQYLSEVKATTPKDRKTGLPLLFPKL